MEQCCEYLSVRCIWLHVLTVSFYRILTTQLNHIWPAWLNGWDFIYELSGSGFESNLVSSLSFGYCSGDEVGFGSRCSHLNFRYCAFFKQRVPWHSGNYRMWIHSNCILDMIRTYNQNYFLYHQSWSSTFKVQLEVIRYPGPVSLDFLRSLCLWKKNLKYGRSMISSWRNRFTFLGGIRLHWQFHTGFREIFKVAWFK